MIDYYNGQISDIMPSHFFADDPARQALSLAIRDGTRMLDDYTKRIYVYCSIETAPEEIIDLLAKELRTQYYRDSMDIEVKRVLVRSTLIWYMTAGTPAAVEELVSVVFGEGEVKEWFDYGGDPYYFKIRTNAALTPDIDAYFSDMIRRVKNTRSHLEAIEIHREIEQPYYAGVGISNQYKPAAVIDGYKVDRESDINVYVGSATETVYKPAAVIDGYKERRKADHTVYSGSAYFIAEKPEAVMEKLEEKGSGINQEVYAGSIQMNAYKPEAVLEDLKISGSNAEQTIYAAQAFNSKYKNIVKEE